MPTIRRDIHTRPGVIVRIERAWPGPFYDRVEVLFDSGEALSFQASELQLGAPAAPEQGVQL
jgi:hypothetical protein